MLISRRVAIAALAIGFAVLGIILLRNSVRMHMGIGPGNYCLQNLRQIAGAKVTWALENKKAATDNMSWADIQPYLGRGTAGSLPFCAQGGTYTLGRVGEPPKCSFPGHVLE